MTCRKACPSPSGRRPRPRRSSGRARPTSRSSAASSTSVTCAAGQGDHRQVPAVALGAAAAAAPRAVGRGARQPGRHPVLRRRAGAHHGRGLGGRHVLHDVQAHAVRRAPGERVHQHAVRGARRRRHLPAPAGEARRGGRAARPRGDLGRRRRHAGARRVPRRVRLRAGASRSTTSTTTTRTSTRPRSWSTPCAAARSRTPRAVRRSPTSAPSSWSWRASSPISPPSVEGLSEAHETLLGVRVAAERGWAAPALPDTPPAPAGEEMTDPITPVLTRRWAEPRSWSIDTYERTGGYQAFRTALRGRSR